MKKLIILGALMAGVLAGTYKVVSAQTNTSTPTPTTTTTTVTPTPTSVPGGAPSTGYGTMAK